MPHTKAYTLSPFISLNGVLTLSSHAHLSYADRGFTLGDGVFETILVRGRKALWLQEHIERLLFASGVLGMQAIASMPSREAIFSWAESLLSTIELPDTDPAQTEPVYSVLRMTLTRGVASGRGLYLAPDVAKPMLVMTLHHWTTPQDARAVLVEGTRRNERSPLSSIKSLAYADNILARQEALQRGANEAILMNTRDYLACASVGNLFLQIGKSWYTPTTACGVLPGLARRRLIEVLPAQEVRLEAACVSQVSHAFVSNSLGCSPIMELEGRPLPLSPDWDRIESIYFAD